MSATSDFYLKQAIQNEQDAQAAQLDNVRGQRRVIVTAFRRPTLRRAIMSERRTGATLRHRKLLLHVLNASPATGGA